ncbi:MAG TPA: hypothetical protein PLV25_07050, partial [Opitutales bacterium]|nr:hypothetical protein [Opitutales bacterium]
EDFYYIKELSIREGVSLGSNDYSKADRNIPENLLRAFVAKLYVKKDGTFEKFETITDTLDCKIAHCSELNGACETALIETLTAILESVREIDEGDEAKTIREL